jgi:hypothetical protein
MAMDMDGYPSYGYRQWPKAMAIAITTAMDITGQGAMVMYITDRGATEAATIADPLSH